MRPRPLSRGNDGTTRHDPEISYGFNEAAAVKPRKRPVDSGREPDNRGFNEAAAVKPRKHARHVGRDQRCMYASMRPRPLSRGNVPLQWAARTAHRHGFNEAAAVKPRKRRIRRVVPDVGEPASMRPRPLSRGNERGGRRQTPGHPASMRPRPLSRGNLNHSPWLLPTVLPLQ